MKLIYHTQQRSTTVVGWSGSGDDYPLLAESLKIDRHGRQGRGTSSRAGAAGLCSGVAAQLARRLRASSERLPGSAVKIVSRSPVSAASSMTS
jgi:hypothetical protein